MPTVYIGGWYYDLGRAAHPLPKNDVLAGREAFFLK
jgi:hypothetical protein